VDLETTGSPKSDKSAFLMGACIGLLALLIHSLVDFNMHVPANAVVAITLMALISAHWRFATQRAWFNPHTIGKILMTAAIVAGMGWLCIQEVDRGREAFWLRRAADETAPVEERLADLKNAYAAEPSNYENAYNVGEYYRLTSQEGNPGYEKLAQQAMEWYSKSWAVNQLDAFVPMRYGMCLDWLGRTNESPSYFGLAAKMDPNNAELSYFEGRHFVELHDYPVAKDWFIHCLAMRWPDSNAVYMLTKVVDAMKEPNGLYK
jgi:tetratricopeptide (TPR) repeat protein